MKEKTLHWLILIIGIIALLCSTSFTLTAFAWGVGLKTYFYLGLYPLLVVALVLVALKSKAGYIITCLVAAAYCILLSEYVIEYLLYRRDNWVLIPVLMIPFMLYAIVIPLIINIITKNLKAHLLAHRSSVIGVILFIVYIGISIGYNKVYCTLYADARFNSNRTVKVVCNPHFGDARQFYFVSRSKELQDLLKKQGKFYQGTWNADLKGVGVVILGTLRTFKITHINKVELQSSLEFDVDQLIGDKTFILP